MPTFDYSRARNAGNSDAQIKSFLISQKAAGNDLTINKAEYDAYQNLGKTPMAAPKNSAAYNALPTKQTSVAQNYLPALGEAALGMAKDIATPFTRTAGTLATLPSSLAGKPMTPEQTSSMGMFKPYETPMTAVAGAAQIGLTLAPEAEEVRVLIGSANAFLKERALLGLGAPKIGTKAAEQEAASLAGRVLQPKTIQAGERASKGLSYVKTEGVNTYQKGAKAAGEQISKMSEVVDKRFAADPMPRAPSVLPPKDAGFIRSALQDMSKVYSKTRSAEDAARINVLASKFEKQGLSPKEINNIAREYNTTFRNKAFRANGEPATSWSGEGYENTRSAVKDAARNLMPDDTTKQLDEAMSKVYSVKDHFENMAEEVLKAKNKVVPVNLAQKLMNILGKGVGIVKKDLGLDSFLKETGLGLLTKGDENLNALELERTLGKNLARIRKINGLEGKNMADELMKMAEEAAGKQAGSLRNLPKLSPAPAAGSAQNPFIAPARGMTPPTAKTGQTVLQPPAEKSGPITPEIVSRAPSMASKKALSKATGIPLNSLDFLDEPGTRLFYGKNGQAYVVAEGKGAMPLNKMMAYEMQKAGYVFENVPKGLPTNAK